jgi:hypothetical protein
MSITYEHRRLLHENLKQLVKSEYEQIFRILKRYNEPYTENSNGIFFDVTSINAETYIDMRKFLDFCIENRSKEQERISELANLRTEVITLLENSVSSETTTELKA